MALPKLPIFVQISCSVSIILISKNLEQSINIIKQIIKHIIADAAWIKHVPLGGMFQFIFHWYARIAFTDNVIV